MHMNAELTIEGVSGIVQRLIRLGCDSRSGSGVHQDSRSGDDLRLIGMQNRDVIERSVEGACALTSHQGDVSVSTALQSKLKPRKRDAGQDQDRDLPETHAACCCGVRKDVDTTVWLS